MIVVYVAGIVEVCIKIPLPGEHLFTNDLLVIPCGARINFLTLCSLPCDPFDWLASHVGALRIAFIGGNMQR